jgi:hypothetical protein
MECLNVTLYKGISLRLWNKQNKWETHTSIYHLKRHKKSIIYLSGAPFNISGFPNLAVKLIPSYDTQRSMEMEDLGDSPFE